MKRRLSISPTYLAPLAAGAVVMTLFVFSRTHAGMTPYAMLHVLPAGLFGILLLLRRERRDMGATACTFVAALALVILIAALHAKLHTLAGWSAVALFLMVLERSRPGRSARDLLCAWLLLGLAFPLSETLYDAVNRHLHAAAVESAERLLQTLNFRVWADGPALVTGRSLYPVPPAAVGLPVLLFAFCLGLGLAALHRHRGRTCAVLSCVAVLEAFLLNVTVTAATPAFIPAGREEYREALLAAPPWIAAGTLLAVGLNTVGWLRLRATRRRQQDDEEAGVNALPFREPPFWHALTQCQWHLPAALLLAAVFTVAGLRNRAAWRARLIKDVAVELRKAGRLHAATRAAQAAWQLAPDDAWAVERARLLVLQEKFDRALPLLNLAGQPDRHTTVKASLLRAFALYRLGRSDEAYACLADLPYSVRASDGRLPMLMAKLSVLNRRPDQAAYNVVLATEAAGPASWIASLYPFLRRHAEWETIAATQPQTMDLDSPEQAFSAMEAFMNLGNTPEVAYLVRRAMEAWPADPRLLEPLFYMVCTSGTAEWQEAFAREVALTVADSDRPDDLYRILQKAFLIQRPDLGWLAYRRIRNLDAAHPALWLAAAQYGFCWFTFRTEFLGLSSMVPDEFMDLKPHVLLAPLLPGGREVLDLVPLHEAWQDPEPEQVRRDFLERAITEFARREASGSLSVPMHFEYARALDMAGRTDESRRELQRLATERGQDDVRCRLLLSEMHERREAWVDVYEALRGYSLTRQPTLRGLLRLVRAGLDLGLGLPTLHAARLAARRHPRSSAAVAALARALLRYDSAEAAVFVLSQSEVERTRDLANIEAEALTASQRYTAVPEFQWGTRGGGPDPDTARQDALLRPAEAALDWDRLSLPTDADFARHARHLNNVLPSLPHTFLARTARLWLEAAQGTPSALEPGPWVACGRNRIEEATALHQLALLLCRQGAADAARRVTEQAVRHLPESPLLQRLLISLSDGDARSVDAARLACPEDPEIWLAALVIRTRRTREPEDAGRDVLRLVQQAAENKTFPPATMARAADYLMRLGMHEPAGVAARDAASRGRGLLPVFLLGLKYSLAEGDTDWAVECTKQAIASSLRPNLFLYKKLVELKTRGDDVATDADMLEALKTLRSEDPGNALWAHLLGYVRLQRGSFDVVDAMNHMQDALEGGLTNRSTYLAGAQAAMYVDNFREAERFLREGRRHHPDDTAILNNLVHALASYPEGLPEARSLLPRLLGKGGNDPAILDTIADVYIKTAQLARAEDTVYRILRLTRADSAHAFRAKMHLARINLLRGNAVRARTILNDILTNPRLVPAEDIRSARSLLEEAESVPLLPDEAGTGGP